MMDKSLLDHIIEIGKQEAEVDIHKFLPDFPTPHGSEPIFKIGWANASRHLRYDVENLVKGLHHIEMNYKELTNNDFGLGSPFPSFKIILALHKQKADLAKDLFEWVDNHGGNYYIPARKLT